jgi:hypothetical protein
MTWVELSYSELNEPLLLLGVLFPPLSQSKAQVSLFIVACRVILVKET